MIKVERSRADPLFNTCHVCAISPSVSIRLDREGGNSTTVIDLCLADAKLLLQKLEVVLEYEGAA